MNNKGGFTLFLAMTITGTLLLVATGVASLAIKQSKISTSARDSQIAFYAADSALECALFWDVKNPSGFSAFLPDRTASINCNQDVNNPTNQWLVGGNSTSVFTVTFEPDPFCAIVYVTKQGNVTQIDSLGYNTCDSSSSRRVQRAIRASY